MMNENRNLFSLHGMTGFLIATVLLVVVVLSLAYLAYLAQVANATNYYDIKDKELIKMNSVDNAKHIVDVK